MSARSTSAAGQMPFSCMQLLGKKVCPGPRRLYWAISHVARQRTLGRQLRPAAGRGAHFGAATIKSVGRLAAFSICRRCDLGDTWTTEKCCAMCYATRTTGFSCWFCCTASWLACWSCAWPRRTARRRVPTITVRIYDKDLANVSIYSPQIRFACICRYRTSGRRLPGNARHPCPAVSGLCAQADTLVCLCGSLCQLYTGGHRITINQSIQSQSIDSLSWPARCRAARSGKWSVPVCAARSRASVRRPSRCSVPRSSMVSASLRKSSQRRR